MENQTLRINKNKRADITPGMIGLFYEDINYSCDGGIHAEMIENPAFEFVEAMGYNEHYSTKFDGLYGWIPYPSAGDGGELSVGSDTSVSPTCPHYLRFRPSSSQTGFANKAFDGIFLKAGASYTVSAWLRGRDYTGKVTVSVLDGERPALSAVLAPSVTGEWVKYEVFLAAEENLRQGRFVVSLDGSAPSAQTGVLEADFISMKPQDAVMGVFRRDLADALKEIHPGFLRFPGGCVVEGNELSNRYRWKSTVGPLEWRAPNWNRWAVHNNPKTEFSTGPYSHYNQTCAIGYYEYFLLCEYIGARPLPVQNVGLACQYQTFQRVEPENPAFQEFIDDVLDLIEFANGPADSRWGAVRAEMGHPAPFNLEMIGIGNEQWETESSRFFERYSLFEKAIHHKYPTIKLIGSAGPDVTSRRYTDAWNFYREKAAANPNFTYAVDEHYYRPAEWMYQNSHFYDNYPRNIKVFAGEYAAHVVSGMNRPDANTLGAALSEAAFLTGVERNADVVVLASYAPLLARAGYAQWSPDLIWFDGQSCYGTPSYYVQKLYASNMGSYTVESTLAEGSEDLYQTVSYDETRKELIVKLVNAAPESREIRLELAPAYSISGPVRATVLTGNPEDCNSLDKPEKIAPSDSELSLNNGIYTAPAASFSVIRVPAV